MAQCNCRTGLFLDSTISNINLSRYLTRSEHVKPRNKTNDYSMLWQLLHNNGLGTWGLYVHLETHPAVSQLFKTVLKFCNCTCVHHFLWQTIPLVNNSFTEKETSAVRSAARIDEFHWMTMGTRITWQWKKSFQQHSRDALDDLEKFNQAHRFLLSSKDHRFNSFNL